MSKSIQSPPFSLRLPPEMREYLEAEAKKNFRSLTGEVVMRLTKVIAEELAEKQRKLHGE